MKIKNVLKFFAILVALLLIILGYKIILLNKYKSEKVMINTNDIFGGVLTINKKQEVADNEIIKFENLSIKNYFKEYVENEGDSDIKVKYDNDGKVISFYSISKTSQYIDMLNFNSFDLYSASDDGKYNFETEESMKLYLKNNAIENDIDFLKYIKNNYYIKNNIFMSRSTIKNNFLINCFVEVTLPDFETISLIDGIIKGYMINMKNPNTKEIHMLYNDQQYILLLSGEEIANKEFISNMLETVKFDG